MNISNDSTPQTEYFEEEKLANGGWEGAGGQPDFISICHCFMKVSVI